MDRNTAHRVLERLYDRGEGFFLLEELAAAAGLPRRRLDAALADLARGGHRLEFSPAHGVRLIRPIALSAPLIERGLDTTRIGRSVLCFDEVDSTNDVAMDSARQKDTDGLVVLAESQRRGRGRHGRRWSSRPGANVLLSVLLIEPPGPGQSHDAMTIAAGLAVAEGIEIACGPACRLKWPNDVLLDDRKVAGVLVETRRLAHAQAVVVGIGINVNDHPPEEEVDAPAADLAGRVGLPVERTEVIRAVLRRLDFRIIEIEAEHREGLHRAWLARCGMINERLTVRCGRQCYVGRVLDVDPLEGLVLCCDDGQQVRLPAERSTIVRKDRSAGHDRT